MTACLRSLISLVPVINAFDAAHAEAAVATMPSKIEDGIFAPLSIQEMGPEPSANASIILT
jgi:hypothetical protein